MGGCLLDILSDFKVILLLQRMMQEFPIAIGSADSDIYRR